MTKEISVEATIDNVPVVTEFTDGVLEEADCSMKAQMQIDVAIDEMFSNIAFYAYGGESGPATVKIEITDAPKTAKITFIDNGAPYNPLEKDDPDTTLSAEERGIGGLGIFIVKKSMDDVFYSYEDGKNMFTMVKVIE